jgi:DNA-directed RNA polymerase specialized sigma24 family protein
MSRTAWTLSPAAFDGLLAALDPDRDRAAAEYERLRARLVKLFTWRGCVRPDEYADRTFDRVARRLAEGAEIHLRDPYGFFHGVALNLLQEYWREPSAQWTPIDAAPNHAALAQPAAVENDDAADHREAHLACLDRCLGELRPEGRQLLARYHPAESDHIAARRTLAEELGIPLNALRIRVFRLRAALERCVSGCVGLKRNEDSSID